MQSLSASNVSRAWSPGTPAGVEIAARPLQSTMSLLVSEKDVPSRCQYVPHPANREKADISKTIRNNFFLDTQENFNNGLGYFAAGSVSIYRNSVARARFRPAAQIHSRALADLPEWMIRNLTLGLS
jgi:hypothetical protein